MEIIFIKSETFSLEKNEIIFKTKESISYEISDY